MLTSVEFYDRLTWEQLADYNQKHSQYRYEVDQIVLENAPHTPRYLDVGCGDGYRSSLLSYAINAQSLTMCDNSEKMQKRAEKYGPVWADSAEKLWDRKDDWGKFDLITCLDVLKHTDIYKTIGGFSQLLAYEGILIFDLGICYNVRTVGWWHICSDLLREEDQPTFMTIGDLSTEIKLRGPEDVEGDWRYPVTQDMNLLEKLFLDAETGERRSRWTGDAVYVLQKKSLKVMQEEYDRGCKSNDELMASLDPKDAAPSPSRYDFHNRPHYRPKEIE